jgi:clusterin-associated protein 1
VHRYDDSAELSHDISTEDARINFLKASAEFMANKAHVKLNIKQLYRADGFAVRELLKICRVLYKAVQIHPTEIEASNEINVSSKLEELKDAKSLAGEIVASGAKLSQLLANEEKLKVNRDRALKFLDSISLNLDSDSHDQIERNIRQEISLITERIAEYEKLLVDLESDEKSFAVKIDKKKRALIGAEKRLRNHKKIRPDYMEDYEQAEADLKHEYETYLERFRNLYYLEHELEKYHLQEAERKAIADKQLERMQRRLRVAADLEQNGEAAGILGSDSDDDHRRNKPLRRRNVGNRSSYRDRPPLDASDEEESEEESGSDDEAPVKRNNLRKQMDHGSDSASESEEYYDEGEGDASDRDPSEEVDEEDYDESSNDGNV